MNINTHVYPRAYKYGVGTIAQCLQLSAGRARQGRFPRLDAENLPERPKLDKARPT